MELWFVVAVCGAIASGVSNFFFKIAAARNCNAELFMFYSSVTSMLIAVALVLVWQQPIVGYGFAAAILLGSGVISAASGSLKVYALRYIDATIYFPLFKLITPALAILAGVTLFAESFSTLEWTGLVIGLLVPIILISPGENTRQQNLTMGLLLVLITGVLSALTAVAGKYAIDMNVPVFTTLLLTVVGLSLGSIGLMAYQRGVGGISALIRTESTPLLLKTSITRAALISFGVWTMLFAFSEGGSLFSRTDHSLDVYPDSDCFSGYFLQRTHELAESSSDSLFGGFAGVFGVGVSLLYYLHGRCFGVH